MKRIFALIFLLSGMAFAQTFTVSGHVVNPNTGVPTGAQITFKLINSGTQQCKVSGTGLIVPNNQVFTPDVNGLISGTLYRNDFIVCGNQSNTQWSYVITAPGVTMPTCALAAVTTTSLNVDSAACTNTVATVTPPTGDTTYCRLDGSNCGFTGNVTSTATIFCKNFENIRCVDSTNSGAWGGLDVGAWINSAYANLPSTGGTIMLGPMQLSFSTPVVFGTASKPACLIGSGIPSTVLTFTAATGTAFSYSPVNLGACFEHLTLTTSTSTTSVGVQFNYVNEGLIFDAKVHGFFGGIRVTGDGVSNSSSGIRIDQTLVDFGTCSSGGYGMSFDHVNDLIITGMRNYLTGGGSGNCNLTNGVILDRGVGGVLNMAGTIEGGLHSVIVQNTSLGGAYGGIPASIFPHDLFMDTPSGGAALLLDSSLGTTAVRWHCVGCWVAVAGQSSLGVITVGTAPGIDIEGGSDVEFTGGVCRVNAAECAKINSTGSDFSIHGMSVYDNNQNNGAGIAAFNITANPSNVNITNNLLCGNGVEAGGHSQYCADYHLSTNGTSQVFGNNAQSLGIGPYNFSGSTLKPFSASQFMVNDTFPAASGAIRLAEANGAIHTKNHAVSGDITIITKDTADDVVQVGDTTGVKFLGVVSASGSTAALTADWTCGTGGTVASCVAATIIGSGGGVPLTITLPLAAQSYTLECNGVVGQATAATLNQWNLLTATNGATNVTATYDMATAATAYAVGAVTDQGSTTTTFQITPSWTLGGTATKMPFHIWAKIEGAAAAGTVVSLQLLAPTVGDLVTIYRGSSCRVY